MDFMKVIDQTVREIKREVNLKVLKVPEIEQKVLDATDDEPWGPHGSALAEIAQATKKFSECQMVMNVLWTRLGEISKNWRYVYKSLAVIEYLVGNGSERAVDDIVEHTFQISSLASFEYVEPNGKDMGINVRKKAETIVSLLNNKDKIQEVRNKAAANREKYFGLSSTGITYKSGSVSSGSSSFQNSDRYGGFNGTKDSETFKDTYTDNDRFGQEKSEKSTSAKSHRNTSKKESSRKGGNTSASGASRPATANNDSDKYASVPAQNSIANSNNDDDDFDDFDPRGTSGSESALGKSNQEDLFGQSLVGDLMDAPASVPEKASTGNSNVSEVDLFADATFVSAPPHVEAGGNSEPQAKVDLFASKPASSPSVSSSVDFFSTPDPIVQTDKTSSKFEPINTNAVDPFAAVPLNSFDGSDLFGAFTSNADASSAEATKKSEGSDNNLNGKSSAESKPPPKKDSFQVKSGIWSDSLSRGLIDLNISAPKKVSLADIGIVGGLSDGSDEKDKGPPTSFYMGRAMGAGSGIGRSSGFTSSTGTGSDDMFSNLGGQQYQFGGFK
ncbi:clathrin interactor EPSIN 1 isoform X1 [Rhododendron vialii]|uniref:clathrin interactor EPSIN 1 isoform X1 n=1 Tax=Rhododendron vialii TaxID=182163 RepID=UPI00265F3BF6|nr:clathrin interactor EPSIN 1 isoform X1 [Rhododendron vialii]XP_058222406.1 clathrin interactor EPSIN 1 isoform X1 [Rhododendron vialii]